MEVNNKKVRERFSKYLKNKRVVIVGPAASIIGSEQKALIDSFDVVVRLNKAFPVDLTKSGDIGTRTDIIYNCMNPEEECGGQIHVKQLVKHGVKFLVGAYPPIDKIGTTKMRMKKDLMDFYAKTRLFYHDFCYTDRNHFMQLWNQMKLPNTGFMAIADLLRFQIKELYITGITFFKGGYYRDYRNYDEKGILEFMDKFGLHKPDKQLKYMVQVLKADPRIKCDAPLEEIINSVQQELTPSDQPEEQPEEQPVVDLLDEQPDTQHDDTQHEERSTNQPEERSTNQPEERSTNQPEEQPIDQSIDQLADQEFEEIQPQENEFDDEPPEEIILDLNEPLTDQTIFYLASNSVNIYKL